MMMIANSHDDDDSHDDSYSSISSPIYPSIYRLIMDIKINISIDTLCYGLPGKHCYNHAAAEIMSSSIQHLFIICSASQSSPSIHRASIHHHQMSSIHQYVHSLSFDDTLNYVYLLRLYRELFKNMQYVLWMIVMRMRIGTVYILRVSSFSDS